MRSGSPIKPVFLLLITSICLQSLSQKDTSQAEQNNFPFTHFEFLNYEQGLNSREIFWLMQDKKGFIWIITDHGLKRYDGYTFRSWSYNPNDSNAFVNSGYFGMTEDKNGTLWMPNVIEGFYSFDPYREKFTHFRNEPGNSNSLIDDNAYAIAAERNGDIWIGTEKGLDKYNPQTKTFTHFANKAGDSTSISNNIIYSIEINERDTADGGKVNLWLINEKLGIDCFNTKDEKVIKHFTFPFFEVDMLWGDDFILNINGLKNDVFWIGSNDRGIYGFNTLTEQFIHIKPPHECHNSLHIRGFQNVMEDHAGNLWTVNDDNELVYYDRINQIFYLHEVSKTNFAFENSAPVFIEDNSGKVLIGTQNGLLTVDTKQKPFVTFQKSGNNPSFSISDISIAHFNQQKKGQDAVCENIFDLLDRKNKIYSTLSLTNYGDPYPHTGFYMDSKGVFWLAAKDLGIGSYNPVTKKSHQYHISGNSDPVTNKSFTGIIEDLKGQYWASNSIDGLYKLDAATGELQKFTFSKENKFINTAISFESIFRDSKGILYFRTMGEGFITFNSGNETLTIYHHDANDPTSVSSETPLFFHEGKNGLIWFGTRDQGINVFNPMTGKFKAFTTDNELQNFAISIAEDQKGNYWVGSRFGISCFTPPDDPFTPGYKIQFRNYNKNDGLPTNFCSWRSAFCDNDGTVYFGTRGGGIFYFHPDSLKDNSFLPPVYITDFKLRNKTVTINDPNTFLKSATEYTREIKLDYRQNIISFSFAALSYIDPEKNQYKYMLEGYDEDWITTDASKRFANYTNLDPDTYIFKVKGSNNDGVWNEIPTELKIIITPPFWQTGWFRALVVLVIIAIVYGVYRYRMQQVLRLQQIRNRIAADLHDDIGSTLNSISVFSEVAKNDPSKRDESLDMIGNSSRKVTEAMSDIVWTINPDNDSFEKVILRMRSLSYNLLRAKNIEFTFRADEDLNSLKLSMEKRKSFYLIFKEILNNLIKYSQASHVSFSLTSEEDKIITLTILDNGVGFDTTKSYSGNGLNNMRRRAKEIGAKLIIDSHAGTGTTIQLIIKS